MTSAVDSPSGDDTLVAGAAYVRDRAWAIATPAIALALRTSLSLAKSHVPRLPGRPPVAAVSET